MKKFFSLFFVLALLFAFGATKVSYATDDLSDFAEELEKGLQELSADVQADDSVPTPEPVETPNTVTAIEVRGNQIVSTNTILSKLRSREGGPLAQTTINEDLKRLYATGYFQDIKMEAEESHSGYRLVISVVEKPIVRQIVLKGFTLFKEDKLRKTMKVIEGQILDRKVIKEGVEEIKKLYAGKGYRFVNVKSEVDVNRESKEATVYISIEEGQKYIIRGVSFEGNTAFPEKKLVKMLRTKKRATYLFRRGVFKEDLFNKDLERVSLFYQQEGYLDVKVIPDFKYDEDENSIYILVKVDEGQHYLTGDITITGNALFPQSDIWQELEMLPGKTYSQFYLSQDVEAIRAFYHSNGYVDARIIPDVRLNRANGKVDIAYKIQEGDLYFIEKVVVRGNTKTKDIVIRRELRIRPGEKFDGDKIKKSKQRLENLGFFEEITYDTEPSQTATNRKDLIFRVKEKRTGELSFGGGVSSVDRFVGFAEISQRNFDFLNFPRFTGGGQSLSVRARVGTISQDYSINFVEPYLFNKPISFGADIFNNTRDSTNVDFEEERRGFGLTLSKRIKDIYSIGTGYTLERVNIDDVSDDAPVAVRDFAGKNTLSRGRIFAGYDTRDNVFNPREGMNASLSAELVGSVLGGDQDFYIVQGNLAKYFNFFNDHVLETRFRLGAAQEIGDSKSVPIFDRFYAGGLGSVRGFNYRRVGPIEAGDAVGGRTLAVANFEYTVPIPKLDSFRASIFMDVGNVDQGSYELDFSNFSTSIGPGIKIKTPIGPVAFYYGFPISNKDTEDENGRFEFSLSRGF